VKAVRPPSGLAPPSDAPAPGGGRLDLVALATAITDEHLEQFPEELEERGPAARDWGIHDGRWLLFWAAHDHAGDLDLLAQVRWLAGVLDARDYPLKRLEAFLRRCAEHVPALGDRLREAAASVQRADEA
jgi:hypothetical protein